MRIVVISDTHIPKKAKQLPEQVLEDLRSSDLIVHAGDWQVREVYENLSAYGKVVGVYGNVDEADIRQLVPEKQVIEAGTFKIGIIHGHGEKGTTEKRALSAFEEEDVDCIIFGHSHIPYLRYFKGKLLFNPGSLTDKRRLPYFSYGILEIGDTIKAQHNFF